MFLTLKDIQRLSHCAREPGAQLSKSPLIDLNYKSEEKRPFVSNCSNVQQQKIREVYSPKIQVPLVGVLIDNRI